MKNQKGFSLIELLVVVIIIGIIAAIAIPSLLASRRAANEGSAIASTRSLGTAQATYQATTGNGVSYAADNTGLVGFVDDSLDSVGATKSGYEFNTTGGANQLAICSEPTTPGSTGVRYFSMQEDYVVYSSAANATCAAGGAFTAAAGATAIGN